MEEVKKEVAKSEVGFILHNVGKDVVQSACALQALCLQEARGTRPISLHNA